METSPVCKKRWRRTAVAIRGMLWCGILLSALATAQLSIAQQAVAPREAVVTPPRAKEDPGVNYPESALREHISETIEVDLVLEIDTDGHVTQARIEQSRGRGLDEAAISAAQKLLFFPATRDGRPVAAKIKFRYVFNPPSPVLTGRVRHQSDDLPIANALVSVRAADRSELTTLTAADGSWSMQGLAPGLIHLRVAADGFLPAEMDENLEPGQEINVLLRLAPEPNTPPSQVVVTVTGERPPREVSKRVLVRDEIQHSAGTQGDALLSVQNLPGIARPPPFSGALVVRGSAPDDTAVLVDGPDVPLAYHFGGLSSVVPTELLNQIDFYPGKFSARYGRKMGGIVDVQLRPPRVDGYHVIVENSLLGFRSTSIIWS